MVRHPLTPEQHDAGARLGSLLREARADRKLDAVAKEAGISPETLRKIETGRLPTPAFGTIVCLADALALPVQDLAARWRSRQVPPHGWRVRCRRTQDQPPRTPA